jgi:hypothetical protein
MSDYDEQIKNIDKQIKNIDNRIEYIDSIPSPFEMLMIGVSPLILASLFLIYLINSPY